MTNEELALAIQSGNREEITQLWRQCFGFIRSQAIRWFNSWENIPGFDIDDLTQSGYIALCEAVRAFQAERGSFISVLALYLKTEFAKASGCRTKAQLKDPLNSAKSLDAPAYNDDDSETTVADIVPFDDPGFEEVEEAMHRDYISGVVKEAVYSLPERQRIAIEAHYLDGKTYVEIADILNVANSYPGQLVKDGFRNLRNSKYAPTLSDLLYGDKNLYKRTGYSAWKATGCSVQEYNLLWNEREVKWHKLKDTRESKIRYCIDHYGMTMEQARRLFPA